MLLVLNLPLVGVWASLLRIPYRRLYPCILLFCIIGVYTTTASTFSLWVMLVFGVLGYFMRKLDIPSAPVLLGMVLLPYVDGALGQSLLMASGNPTIFFTRPISASILGVLALVLVVPLLRKAIPGRAGKPASTSSGTRWKTDERNK